MFECVFTFHCGARTEAQQHTSRTCARPRGSVCVCMWVGGWVGAPRVGDAEQPPVKSKGKKKNGGKKGGNTNGAKSSEASSKTKEEPKDEVVSESERPEAVDDFAGEWNEVTVGKKRGKKAGKGKKQGSVKVQSHVHHGVHHRSSALHINASHHTGGASQTNQSASSSSSASTSSTHVHTPTCSTPHRVVPHRLLPDTTHGSPHTHNHHTSFILEWPAKGEGKRIRSPAGERRRGHGGGGEPSSCNQQARQPLVTHRAC